jgi:DNA-binding transcriptional ArsR family regulator
VAITEEASSIGVTPLAEPDLVRVLQAMSDPQRLKMLKALDDDAWHPCGAGDWGTDLHKSTVSHHVKILREAGLLETKRIGRNKHGRLRRDAIEGRFPGLLDGVLINA